MSRYKEMIYDILNGHTPELKDIPRERLDWNASTAFLDLFHRTDGPDREDLIGSMGTIIAEGSWPPAVLAELVDLANDLELSQLEPSVKLLSARSVASESLVHDAVSDFLAYRRFARGEYRQESR